MLYDMKQLIVEYVARQQLVYEAILQLSPVKLVVHDKSIDTLEVCYLADKYKHIPGRGIWQRYGTWHYFLHGGGCRLTNIISGEPIEWDAPHLNRFYVVWFVNWLSWAEQMNGVVDGVSDKQINAIFNELVEQGFLKPTHPNINSHFYLVDA